MKRGGGLHPARPDCWPPTKRPRATPGGLLAASVTCLSRREGVPPCFGRNPRGSPDFLAYPVPKACMHVLGTRVPRRLGVARSASSPKAALALGCSLTPGLRISFGRVTCMARAASVPGLWALGFLLLACVCGWVRVPVGRGFCLPLPVVAGVLGGCVWVRFVVLSLFCRLFVVFVVGLMCGPAFGPATSDFLAQNLDLARAPPRLQKD